MKTINEIKEQYPFFSNASQPSAPGEIFINRHLLTADIIKVGYRDELLEGLFRPYNQYPHPYIPRKDSRQGHRRYRQVL